MATSVLVGYATGYGSTREVAEAVAATLREYALVVDLQPVRSVDTLAEYSAVVIGAPLFIFRWHKDAHRFLKRHHKELMERPVAIFALGPIQDPFNEKEWQDSNAQLDKELAKYPWLTPAAREMFGGKYDPQALRFPLKMFAGDEPASDIRDWKAIRTWASSLGPKLELEPR
jgi:menaquinone-dependent protoporphyrinogen oxidase